MGNVPWVASLFADARQRRLLNVIVCKPARSKLLESFAGCRNFEASANRIGSIRPPARGSIALQRHEEQIRNLSMHFGIECSARLNIGRIGTIGLRDYLTFELNWLMAALCAGPLN
jgi:hypothetical protein